MSIFKKIIHGISVGAKSVAHVFADAWNWTKKDGAHIAVAAVEEIQSFQKSGALGFLASIADSLTKSKVPGNVIDAITKALPNVLAGALALQGLPENPTDEQVQTLEKAVLDALGVKEDRSEFYSTIGAKITAIIRAESMPGVKFTFAKLVADVEDAYQTYVVAYDKVTADSRLAAE